VSYFIDFILHLDRHLLDLAQAYGPWIYGLLFAIVFAETGLVVTPILPGDSLLFAAGALAAVGALNGATLVVSLAAAAFTGNLVNYAIGRAVGPRIFTATDTRGWSHKLLNREYLARGHAFFEKYGVRAVVLSRFVPIVRTFVPFVAGIASMDARTFGLFNAVGAVAWVGLCVGAGLLFGNIPVVKNNFSLVTLGIVAVSFIPVVVELIRHRLTTT
jgi:membrane-associated protein